MSQKDKIKEEKGGEEYTMRQFLEACISGWLWFVISVVVICSLAMVYVMRKQPVYSRMEQILIKNQDEGTTTSAIEGAFASMGLGSTKANVYNELVTLQSPALVMQVIQNLDLQMDYQQKKFPHNITLYRSTLPFKVKFEDLGVDDFGSVILDINPGGDGKVVKVAHIVDNKLVKEKTDIPFGSGKSTVKTPVGRITLAANPEFSGKAITETTRYIVTHQDLEGAVLHWKGSMGADLADRDAEVIDITVKDVCIQRAVDFLNAIVDQYNQDWINDKNKMAVATSKFIDDRLAVIQQELGDVDVNIADYKSKTMIPDLESMAKITMETTSEISSQMLEAGNQLSMARYVRDYVTNSANANNVIPVNTGIGASNMSLEQEIVEYNKVLLARNSIVETTSISNPIVKEYDARLKGMRQSIVQGVNNQVQTMERVLQNLQGAKGNVQGELASSPKQAMHLLGIERQQKVKEELYLYLLQKREENELSQTFTSKNSRVITPPYGSSRPIAPKKTIIMGIAFLLSLVLPAAVIYLKESSNSKVRSRKDLENMSAPFAGEIPFAGKKVRFETIRKVLAKTKKKKGKRKLETVPVKVEAGNRDMINESFRIVRSNIDRMIAQGDTSNVMMITSFNPGSGKSFITFNLAASFAIKRKSVLVVDCDLRHGSASQFVGMPPHGFSNYLEGATDDWQSLCVEVKDTPGMYVMPIGHRPPNPAELLENGRMKEFLEEAGKAYDYVLLDCPPLNVVVDTQIVEKYVNQAVFVIRAGLLERSAIAEIDELYKSRRFKHMSILLNGTMGKNSRYTVYGSSYYTQNF